MFKKHALSRAYETTRLVKRTSSSLASLISPRREIFGARYAPAVVGKYEQQQQQLEDLSASTGFRPLDEHGEQRFMSAPLCRPTRAGCLRARNQDNPPRRCISGSLMALARSKSMSPHKTERNRTEWLELKAALAFV